MVLFFGFEIPELVLAFGGIIWLAASVLGFIFGLAMAADALKRNFSKKQKYFWAVVSIIIPFASLLYYFLYVYKK